MELGFDWTMFLYLIEAIVALWVGKKVFDWSLGSDDRAVQEDNNLAAGLRRAGLYLALPLGLYGSLTTGTGDLGYNLVAFGLEALLLILLLRIAVMINDRAILTGVDTDNEIDRGNLAVGVVECGMLLATGLIAWGAFTGESATLAQGMLTATVFFLVGQVGLVLIAALYERLTRWEVRKQITQGNTAAGVQLAGLIVALGVILGASVSGDFTGWVYDLLATTRAGLAGIVILLLLSRPIDHLFLPNTDLATEITRDQNVAALSLSAGVQIALALVVTVLFV